jgi:hypothetical protein
MAWSMVWGGYTWIIVQVTAGIASLNIMWWTET